MQYDFKLCRICAKVAKTCSSQTLFDRNRKEVLRKIALVTGVALRNKRSLPQQICQECEMDLNHSFEFRRRCINAQTYFTSAAYKSHSNSTLNSNSSFTDFGNRNVSSLCTFKTEEILVEQENISDHRRLENNEYQAHNTFETETEIYFKAEPCTEDLVATNKVLQNKVASDVEYPEFTVSSDNIEHGICGEAIEIERSASSSRKEPNKLKPVKFVDENNSDNEEKYDTVTKKTTQLLMRKKGKHTSERDYTFICDQCGNNYKCRQHLQIHLKRHSGVKPYQCEICPDKFFTHSELTRHMRRHTGERPFACKYCERRFTDYSTRLKHERTHTNERPFACNQCDKAFTTSYILKNHMLVHTGERSFECKYCSRSFQRQTHLIVHNRSIMHQQNVEKAQQLSNYSTSSKQDT